MPLPFFLVSQPHCVYACELEKRPVLPNYLGCRSLFTHLNDVVAYAVLSRHAPQRPVPPVPHPLPPAKTHSSPFVPIHPPPSHLHYPQCCAISITQSLRFPSIPRWPCHPSYALVHQHNVSVTQCLRIHLMKWLVLVAYNHQPSPTSPPHPLPLFSSSRMPVQCAEYVTTSSERWTKTFHGIAGLTNHRQNHGQIKLTHIINHCQACSQLLHTEWFILFCLPFNVMNFVSMRIVMTSCPMYNNNEFLYQITIFKPKTLGI